MRDFFLLAIHLLVTFAKLLRLGGVHAVAAESLIIGFSIEKADSRRRRSPRGMPGRVGGMYFRTVRGETRTPSFTNNSFAIRSSPQSGFSVAIRRMSCRSSSGIGGRPALLFQRQKMRQPSRCPPMTVDGRTITIASRQLNNPRLEGEGFMGCRLEIDYRLRSARLPAHRCTL